MRGMRALAWLACLGACAGQFMTIPSPRKLDAVDATDPSPRKLDAVDATVREVAAETQTGFAGPQSRSVSRFCSGRRESRDAIVYLGQQKHSSYDATRTITLNASLEMLRANMRRTVQDADILIFHEGDLDAVANARMCLLREETGWGAPPWLSEIPAHGFWSAGYRFMIRFYAVTIWPTLHRLGYQYVMRMDDDSFIMSPVKYNVFNDMRRRGALYAYRTLTRECPQIFGDFVDAFIASVTPKMGKHRPPRGEPYCATTRALAFYNNWHVTKISWWLEPGRVRFAEAFDRSNLIFTHRAGDLLFQTAAVKLFMPKARRRRYADFTYRHHSVIGGTVTFGGIESGWRDRDAKARLRAYASTYTSVTNASRVRECGVQEDFHGPFRPTLYISPALDAADAHHVAPSYFTSPFCEEHLPRAELE